MRKTLGSIPRVDKCVLFQGKIIKVVETGLGLIVTSVLDGVVGRAGAMEVARAVPRSEENALWPCGLDTGHLFSVQEDASCL